MSTKTKIAVAAVLLAATASIAPAQEFDGNPANRFPAYTGPAVQGPQGFQSAPVRLGDGYASRGTVNAVRPQVRAVHSDSAPVLSGGGY